MDASWPWDALAVPAVAENNNEVQATNVPRTTTNPIRPLGDRNFMNLLTNGRTRAYEKKLLPVIAV